MRRLLLLSILSACGPGFDVGDGDDSGVVVIGDDAGFDAGTTMGPDGGGIVLTQPALAQVESCEAVFERRDEFYDFDTDPSGVRFYGPAEILDGSLRLFPNDATDFGAGINLMFSLSNYRSLGTCTDLLLPPAGGEGRRVATAGKALGDGVSCGIDGVEAELEMIEVSESGSIVLGRIAAPWLSDEREIRMFTFNDGERSICEVMNLETLEVLRLESDRATPVDAIHYEVIVYGDGEAGQTFVHESSTGVPQGPFQRVRPSR